MLGKHVGWVREARDLAHGDDTPVRALQLLEEANAMGDIRNVLHGGSIFGHGDADLVVTPNNDRMDANYTKGDEA